jgi:PAS domain S-box-containing protein
LFTFPALTITVRYVLGAACAAVLTGAVLFDTEMAAPHGPTGRGEALPLQAAVALAAVGLALALGGRRGGLVAERTGLDRLVADLPVAVYQGVVLPDGRFERRYMTASVVRVTGWTADQLPKDSDYLALVPNEDRAIAEDHYPRTVRDGEAISEYRLQRPDGRTGWFRHQTRMVGSTAGSADVLGTLSDITAAHELTQQTASNEVRFRGFLEASPDAIIVTDQAGLIIMASKRVEALFGYDPMDILGMSPNILVPERHRHAHPGHMRGYFDSPEVRPMGRGIALHGLRRDGTEFPVEISLSPYRDGESLLVITAVRDVTRRLQVEEQLRQSQKMEAMGQLTGGIAHDFNNLLTTILGNTELLEWGDKVFDEETNRNIAAIHRAGLRAALLTQQLLAFSREQPLNAVIIDINQLIGTVADILRRMLGANIDVEVVLPADLWPVHLDVNQFENAMLNCAINARDAMPNGGKITIETSNAHLDDSSVAVDGNVRAEYVTVDIRDTGKGMSDEILQRAFEPFFTTKPAGRGTGLGLSQVYGFVKQSGGHIKLLSESGHGTDVRIYLPRHLTDGVPEFARASIPETAPLRGTGMVLVVEDEVAVRDFSAAVLKRLGYGVLTAADSVAALATLEREPSIALLFTDIGLPGMSGRQLADAARRLRPSLKVLFTTGYAQNGNAHGDTLNPDVHLLAKPFTSSSLAKRVSEILYRP